MFEISLFLARAFGIYMNVLGIAMLKNGNRFKALAKDYFKNNTTVFLGGILALFIGSLVVAMHNIWAADWRIIITLIGWLSLLKGIFLIIWPEEAKAFYTRL